MLIGKKTIGTIGYMGGVITLPEPFVWSWTQMIRFNNDYLVDPGQMIHYTRATVSLHSFARNSLVQQMKGDWILMLDTDHQFDPDIAVRMVAKMEKHNIDVLSGLYQFKGEPHSPVLYGWDDKTEKFQLLGKWEGKAEIFEIASAGGGCLMVRKSVFERIKNELKEEPFDIIPPYGEDHSFFFRLKKLGIKAYFDPTIEYNHLMFKPVTMADYDTSGITYSELKEVEGFK